MKSKISSILILAIIILIQINQSKLIYLLQMSRHGAKYPDKNVSATIDPANLRGQLTGVGMRQHYLLGSYLYHDYIAGQSLFSGKLNARQVEIFSTSYQRSIDSAFSQAYGLFPTSDSHTIPDGFPPQFLVPPFDLGSNLKTQIQRQNGQQPALKNGFQPPHVIVDDAIMNYCPNYGVFYSQRLKDIAKNLTTFQGQHQLEITKMILTFNVSILQGTVPSMSDLYDNIMSTINLGRDLPKQFNDYDLKSLRFINDYYKFLLQSGPFGQTLSTPMLRFIIERFNTLKNQQIETKFTYFSGHAENLIQMQAILNLTSTDCLNQQWNNKTVTSLNCMKSPDFGSSLLFEVYQNEETFGLDIKVKYNGDYAYLCEKKSTVCSMEQFLARISKYVHNDYQKQCGVSSSDDQNESENAEIEPKNAQYSQNYLQNTQTASNIDQSESTDTKIQIESPFQNDLIEPQDDQDDQAQSEKDSHKSQEVKQHTQQMMQKIF